MKIHFEAVEQFLKNFPFAMQTFFSQRVLKMFLQEEKGLTFMLQRAY
jgi:hypothetical protein